MWNWRWSFAFGGSELHDASTAPIYKLFSHRNRLVCNPIKSLHIGGFRLRETLVFGFVCNIHLSNTYRWIIIDSFQAPGGSAQDKQWSLCVFDDVIEHTGSVSIDKLCDGRYPRNPGCPRTGVKNTSFIARLLPNRSPVAWATQRVALGAWIFHGNSFHLICWAPKFSAFSSEGPLKIFLGSSLV